MRINPFNSQLLALAFLWSHHFQRELALGREPLPPPGATLLLLLAGFSETKGLSWEDCFSGCPCGWRGDTRDPSVGIWPGVVCLLEEWAAPENWRKMEKLEVVELAL